MKEYNHKLIEQKWQKIWEETKKFSSNLNSNKPKYYVLDMFPYPSGSGLHIGHPEGYTATDILARLKRMQQFEVLHPIGFDSFGLPAEQFAISTGNSPRDFTLKNIKTFINQLKSLGFSFDWDKQLITSEPYYYKHTQWIFSKLFENNLAELKEIEVNWCEKLNTVLANEEVLIDSSNNMVSERGNFPVVKKKMKQWVLKITKYADKLFEGLEGLDWPTSIKKLQKNWIYNGGKKENGLHLKDWIFARQRYWGEPFPIVHLDNGEIYLIDSSNYPIELPIIDNYSFSTDGKPALSNAKEWVDFNNSGIEGKMDLNTMPQWAASSWYYIAYLLKKTDANGNDYILDLDSKEAKQILSKWLPVDLYIGGQEHAVLHLLYARFWHHFLYDIGIVETSEPFQKLYNQGMILGEDGEKMSKSKGNTISPNEIIEKYGADSLRIGEMFMGPLADDKEWSTKTITAINSWLNRIFDIPNKISIVEKISNEETKSFNNFIIKFTKFVEDLKLNNAISEMMIFINFVYKAKSISLQNWKYFLQALSLYAPHIASELFSKISDQNIETLKWPRLDNLVLEQKTKIIIQQNAKLKHVLEFNEPKTINSFNSSFDKLDEEKLAFLKEILTDTKIEIEGIKKIIYIKNKLLNIIK